VPRLAGTERVITCASTPAAPLTASFSQGNRKRLAGIDAKSCGLGAGNQAEKQEQLQLEPAANFLPRLCLGGNA
jgi:hypothetical protein